MAIRFYDSVKAPIRSKLCIHLGEPREGHRARFLVVRSLAKGYCEALYTAINTSMALTAINSYFAIVKYKVAFV